MKLLKRIFLRAPAPAPAPAPVETQPDVAEVLRIAQAAQSVYARRVAAFGKDHPELWRQYFTRAGEAARKEAAREPA